MVAKRLPNERQAQVGATVAAANAAGLLGAADLLAGVGRYGSALSLAVLAFEESVKARTLGAIVAAAAQGRTPGFAEDDLRKIIYSSHQARHEAGLKQHLAATDPDLYGRLMLGMAASPAGTAKLQALDALLASANKMDRRDYAPEFPPEWALKDADLALRAAAGADLALLAALSRQWHAAVDAGHGPEDISAGRLALRQPGTDQRESEDQMQIWPSGAGQCVPAQIRRP